MAVEIRKLVQPDHRHHLKFSCPLILIQKLTITHQVTEQINLIHVLLSYELIFQGSEHMILPLMAMVGELTRRQQELVKIIQAKDKEIDDYKSQGAKVSRSKCCLFRVFLK